jgi:hypothetical protein
VKSGLQWKALACRRKLYLEGGYSDETESIWYRYDYEIWRLSASMKAVDMLSIKRNESYLIVTIQYLSKLIKYENNEENNESR